MSKTQKILGLIRSDLSFFILVSVIVIGLFLILSPKISSRIFPFRRQAILNEFINATKEKDYIDPQGYWKFREFYSPGYFTFSRNGIEKNLTSTFLTFSSPLVSSLDMLTTQTDLNKIFDQKKISKKNIIFINKNSLIYEESPTIIKIVFLLSNSDMKKANGFFDYNGQDKELVGNKNWYNITIIKR